MMGGPTTDAPSHPSCLYLHDPTVMFLVEITAMVKLVQEGRTPRPHHPVDPIPTPSRCNLFLGAQSSPLTALTEPNVDQHLPTTEYGIQEHTGVYNDFPVPNAKS